MTGLLSLAARSAWNRRYVLSLVVGSIALATLLLLTIERVRQDVREGFTQAVAGTDLVVGARGAPVQLLLHAVFRLGNPMQTVAWSSVEAVSAMPQVAWTVPISLGDSYRGFAVVGTTRGYFDHVVGADGRALAFAAGRPWREGKDGVYEAVLGAEVADRLGHAPGEAIALSHGDGHFHAHDHADKPFTVVGVLARTGTPVDRSVHVSLQGLEAVHADWIAGVPLPALRTTAEQALQRDLQPKAVSALLVGLERRTAVFSVQRRIAEHRGEPLMAVLPGVALDELWDIVGAGERALLLVSSLVAVVGTAGLVAVILAGLEQRRRELAILRAVGAGPRDVALLLAVEGSLVTLAGVAIGAAATALLLAVAAPWALAHAGVALRPLAFGPSEAGWLALLLAGGVLASAVPGWRAYRIALADGLQPRL